MKILFGSPFREPFDNGRLMAEALRKAGAQVVHWDNRNSNEIPADAKDCDASVVLKCTHDDDILRRLPGYKVAIFPDALDRHIYLHPHLQQYDRVLSCNDPGPYASWAEFFPLGWSERLAAIEPRPARSIPALFIGTNNSPQRLTFVLGLKNRLAGGLQIYGNGWPAAVLPKPPVYYEDYIATLSKASVVLNCHGSPVGPNLKCFEVPQCAPMIVDRARGLDRIFPADLLSKCQYKDESDARLLLHVFVFNRDLAAEVQERQRKAVEAFSYEKQMARLVEELV